MTTTSKARKKILFIRLDKIGDLICTMPTDEIFGDHFEKTWILAKGMGSIAKASVPVRNFLELDKKNWKKSSEEFSQFLAQEKPEIAISFQAPWWIHYQLWKHGIEQRIGVRSQWHSFLFLNHGLRQKRSRAEKHEFQYNLDLCHLALRLNQEPIPSAEPILKLQAQGDWPRPSKNPYVVVHPGMAGSALNWRQSQYINWMETFLIENSQDIYISGTDADESYLTEIKTHFKNHSRVFNLQSKLNFQQLLKMLEGAYFVLAPSTGVAHLAASLGVHVKAIFSPIRVQHPRRWSPRGAKVQIYLPNIPDSENYDQSCMDQLKVDSKGLP